MITALARAGSSATALFDPVRKMPKSSTQRISLDGLWLFNGLEMSEDESKDAEIAAPSYRISAWREAVVPGVVHLDLMRNDLLPDPFVGMNEKQAAWVEENDWWYRKEFEVSDALLENNQFLLRFEGLDTFATIWLNGMKLGDTDNMFIAWEFPVKRFLVPGRNILVVKFSSPSATLERMEREKGKLVAAFYSPRPYGRKAQYSFGWDWGPRLATSGIWKPVSLIAYRDLFVRHLSVKTTLSDDNSAVFHISAEVESIISSEVDVSVNISCEGEEHSTSVSRSVAPGKGCLDAECRVPSAKLWWPAGYGQQPLYTVRVAVSRSGELLDEAVKTTGVRKVELVQEDDLEGKSFVFKVNSVPIFFKGANWIPADAFLPRVTSEDYSRLLDMTVSANMNMLRVWGGGVYESDEFYSLCDEKGIAVWQDFMFACAEYPEEEQFHEKVRAEAKAVVKRLREHPSIILWCGNNENDWGFYKKLWGMRRDVFLGETIYHEILPEVCSELDPSCPYWPSSPFGGQDPNAERFGDRHSWDECRAKVDDKPGPRWDKGRFISEFGFQAPPHIRTIRDFAGEEDDFLSPVMRHHNKAGEPAMDNLLRLASNYLPQPSRLEETVIFSQVCQGELLREAIEHWRRRKFKTSGVLIWQMNDCWPAISWSLVDYWRNPKAAYYIVRRAFAPVLLSLVHEEQQVQVWLVNDSDKPVSGVIRLTLFDFDGTPLHSKQVPASAPANSSVLTTVKGLQELGFLDSTRHFIHARLAARRRNPIEATLLFSRPREIELSRPGVTWEAKKVGEKMFEVELHSRSFAKAVSLDTKAAVDYSDNFVDLVPTTKKSIVVTTKREIELEDFLAGLKVSTGIFT